MKFLRNLLNRINKNGLNPQSTSEELQNDRENAKPAVQQKSGNDLNPANAGTSVTETGCADAGNEAVKSNEEFVNDRTVADDSEDDGRKRFKLLYADPQADQNEVWESIYSILPLRLRNMMDFVIEKTATREFYGIHYCINNTKYIVTLYLKPFESGEPDSEWHYRVSVSLQDSPYEFSHYLRHGTWSELTEYLKTDDAVAAAMESVIQLIQRADRED